MTYKLTVDQPNLGDEGTIYIHGLGTFQNGKTYRITDELAQNFRVANMVDRGGIDDDPESESFGQNVTRMALGPTIDEAAESMYGVAVVSEKNGTANTETNTNGGDQ